MEEAGLWGSLHPATLLQLQPDRAAALVRYVDPHATPPPQTTHPRFTLRPRLRLRPSLGLSLGLGLAPTRYADLVDESDAPLSEWVKTTQASCLARRHTPRRVRARRPCRTRPPGRRHATTHHHASGRSAQRRHRHRHRPSLRGSCGPVWRSSCFSTTRGGPSGTLPHAAPRTPRPSVPPSSTSSRQSSTAPSSGSGRPSSGPAQTRRLHLSRQHCRRRQVRRRRRRLRAGAARRPSRRLCLKRPCPLLRHSRASLLSRGLEPGPRRAKSRQEPRRWHGPKRLPPPRRPPPPSLAPPLNLPPLSLPPLTPPPSLPPPSQRPPSQVPPSQRLPSQRPRTAAPARPRSAATCTRSSRPTARGLIARSACGRTVPASRAALSGPRAPSRTMSSATTEAAAARTGRRVSSALCIRSSRDGPERGEGGPFRAGQRGATRWPWAAACCGEFAFLRLARVLVHEKYLHHLEQLLERDGV